MCGIWILLKKTYKITNFNLTTFVRKIEIERKGRATIYFTVDEYVSQNILVKLFYDLMLVEINIRIKNKQMSKLILL